MIAVFYDRKNKCEVTSNKLTRIRLQSDYAAIDNEGYPSGTPVHELIDKYGKEHLLIATKTIGEVGYKTENCPDYKNWDNWCMESDLIFLRLEE